MEAKTPKPNCELSVPDSEHLISSLIHASKRLKELGFEYYKPTPEKVIQETLKYAKRQMTWFKRDKQIKWFDASKITTHAIINKL